MILPVTTQCRRHRRVMEVILLKHFNDGTLGDWEVGSDEFWGDSGNPYENFILNSAWLIGDENLQII